MLPSPRDVVVQLAENLCTPQALFLLSCICEFLLSVFLVTELDLNWELCRAHKLLSHLGARRHAFLFVDALSCVF